MTPNRRVTWQATSDDENSWPRSAARAAAWPLAARPQQAERVRRVAFLHLYDENDPEVRARVVAFRQGLEALGWTENRNIRIEHLYSGWRFGQPARPICHA